MRGPFETIPTLPNLRTREQKRRYIRAVIDVHGFNWLVWEVAASGFFTDSYNLFATNVILPSLAYVYWPDAVLSWRETLINCMTLGGSIIGQLLFGYLADKYGRTRLYGIELVIVIFSTITVSASSNGFGGSIAVLPWVVSMRFVMGIGIGAEYPLSASICTEWASTKARARMMAAVFFMQPVGQLVSQLVGLWVLLGYAHKYPGFRTCTDHSTCAVHVDSIWRWVTGVGAIPAVVAIWFRFRIKDPGLYDLDVKNEGDRAIRNTVDVYIGSSTNVTTAIEMQTPPLPDNRANAQDPPSLKQFSLADIHDYFWLQGNWRSLLGTSLCWFLLDFAFYGLGMGSPRTLAKLWTYYPSSEEPPHVKSWNPNPARPDATIFEVLQENARQNLITVCIGSLLGSILLIMIINYIPRRKFLIWSFLWLSFLFFVTGGSFFSVFHTDFHAVTIVLIALCHFSFNLGANTLTFIIPAEIFPTRYRCTCHGIAAASGKAGSVMVQAILPAISHGVKASNPTSNGLGWIFIIFGIVMALGAIFAWGWIPNLQNIRDDEGGLKLPSKTLEVLGEGLRKEEGDGQGMRNKFSEMITPFLRWLQKFREVDRVDDANGHTD